MAARRPIEEEETYYNVELVDSKLGKIHFGPIAFKEMKSETVEEFVGYLADKIKTDGFFAAMEAIDCGQPLAVYLAGDDKSRFEVALFEPDARS